MNGEREGGRPPSRPPPKKNKMNGLVFYIGLGLGLALAAGLRPFLPALLAGALASSGVLGVSFAHSSFDFLQAGWWLLAVTVAFVAGVGAAAAARAGRTPLCRTARRRTGGHWHRGGGVAVRRHARGAWRCGLAGAAGGAAAAGLAQAGASPLLARARARLTDRGAREALTLYARRRLACGRGTRCVAAPARLRGACAVRLAGSRCAPAWWSASTPACASSAGERGSPYPDRAGGRRCYGCSKHSLMCIPNDGFELLIGWLYRSWCSA